MSDIVERLRYWCTTKEGALVPDQRLRGKTAVEALRADVNEAADEIERLREAIASNPYKEKDWHILRGEKLLLVKEVERLREGLGEVMREVMPYHPSWRIWDRVRAALAKESTTLEGTGLAK